MVEPVSILIAVIIVAIVLITFLIIRPGITVVRGGKILAFIALLVFPALAGWMGYSEHMENSKTTGFCLSCHVMEPYGKSLHVDDPSYLAASHFQNNRVPRNNACYTCHTDYTLYGDIHSKLRGLRHVWVQYFGTVPKPEEIKLYTPYNNRECLHCHLGARSFEEGETHNEQEGRMEMIKQNRLSCLTSGCHDTVHAIKTLGEAPMWDPNKKPTIEKPESDTGGDETEEQPENENTKGNKKQKGPKR